MASLTLEGSADQAGNGSLKEHEEEEQLIADDGEPPGGGVERRWTMAQCCRQCAAMIQVYSKHRYKR
jgi:hypothetical protein